MHQAFGCLERSGQVGRPGGNGNVCQPDRLIGGLQLGRGRVADGQALQAHARAWQAVARVQAQWLGIVGLTPLNERGQRAVKQALAILAHRNLPMQHAFARVAAGGQGGAAVYALGFKGNTGGQYVFGIGHKVHQAWLSGHGAAQCRVVHVKPVLGVGVGWAFGARVDGDDFKVRHGKGGRSDLEEAVVRAKLRVLAAGVGRDAQGGLAPLHALLQGVRYNDEVVYLCFHA